MTTSYTHLGTVRIGEPLPERPQPVKPEPEIPERTGPQLNTEFVIANIRAILTERKLAPNWLARHMKGKYTNLNPWISRLMSGKMKPGLRMLFSVANALEVPIERIVGDEYLKQL